MYVAARKVEAKGRADEAGCKARYTHLCLELWYAVGPLVYSKTSHGFYLVPMYGVSNSETRRNRSGSAL